MSGVSIAVFPSLLLLLLVLLLLLLLLRQALWCLRLEGIVHRDLKPENIMLSAGRRQVRRWFVLFVCVRVCVWQRQRRRRQCADLLLLLLLLLLILLPLLLLLLM